MTEIKWIKIVTDIFDDEKILLIESMPEADAIIVIWFKLLCLAGKQNNSGVFLLNGRIPFTDEMFATIFRRPINTVRLALKTFEQFGMIEIINDTVTIPNWEKHQRLDALEASREATKTRVARYREKQKLLADSCNVTCNVTETFGNADREEKNRTDKHREDKKREKQEPFTPPTLDELKSYAAEIGYKNFDAEYFLTYYKTAGWKKSNGKPVTNWKLTMQTWKKQDGDRVTQAIKHNPALDYTQREYKNLGKATFASLDDLPE